MSTVPDTGKSRHAHSPWSFMIARVSGIPIRIHFTFLLFFVWIALYVNPLLIITLFVCVVLHELGHALVAQHYGVQTRDITLYPIGGVAMLQGRPKPAEELWIALAGPAVNVLIAALLAPFAFLTSPHGLVLRDLWSGRGNFVASIMSMNILLAAFNLLPAFPMDGGRVLRAALALRMPEVRATQIAATIGQAMAIAFGVWGLFNGQIILMLIAFFVYLGAGQEASAVLTRSFLTGHTVHDAMVVRFRTVEHGASLEAAAQMLLDGSQQDFPVKAGDTVEGVLTRRGIAQGLARSGPSAYVAEAMNRNPKTVTPDMALESAMELFTQNDGEPALVMKDGELIGMLTSENLSEFIMLAAARVSRPA